MLGRRSRLLCLICGGPGGVVQPGIGCLPTLLKLPFLVEVSLLMFSKAPPGEASAATARNRDGKSATALRSSSLTGATRAAAARNALPHRHRTPS